MTARFIYLLRVATLVLAGMADLRADNAGLPGPPFDAARYRTLWESSPFAVASPVAVESVQYSLVGAAAFDGVVYASVVDKQSGDHFVVSSNAASHGLSLLHLDHGAGTATTSATLQKDGGILKLTLESVTPAINPPSIPQPMPAMNPSAMGSSPYSGAVLLRHRAPHARVNIPPVFVPTPPSDP